MTVFADIASAVVAELKAAPTIAAVRDSQAGVIPQTVPAVLSVELGRSFDEQSSVAFTDWRTDILVVVEARQVSVAVTAASQVDGLLGQVIARLRETNTSLMARFAGLAVMALNRRPGDRRIERDTATTDGQLASATYILSVYHRTQGDGLTPWPA